MGRQSHRAKAQDEIAVNILYLSAHCSCLEAVQVAQLIVLDAGSLVDGFTQHRDTRGHGLLLDKQRLLELLLRSVRVGRLEGADALLEKLEGLLLGIDLSGGETSGS